MNWIYLLLAGICEIVWAVALKYTDGFTKWMPTVIFGFGYLASVGLLGISMKTIPFSTAYLIWTGIGTLGCVVYGMMYFNEPVEFWRLFFISMILIGIAGLKYVSPES